MPVRNTTQRRIIREIFKRATRPLSTQEVLAEAQRVRSSLGIATVYRTLKLLTQENWLRIVRLPGVSPRYELATTRNQHHFFCKDCQRAFRTVCRADLLTDVVPSGFVVEDHNIVLYGRCNECCKCTAHPRSGEQATYPTQGTSPSPIRTAAQ